MGMLTVLLLLVAAFSGYILVTIWQVNQSSNSTTMDIHADIKNLRDGQSIRYVVVVSLGVKPQGRCTYRACYAV